MNGAGWAKGFPRLMSNTQLEATLEAARNIGKGRFICVGDISCDIEVCTSLPSLQTLKFLCPGWTRVFTTLIDTFFAILSHKTGQSFGASTISNHDVG
jgi:hypothetical protein